MFDHLLQLLQFLFGAAIVALIGIVYRQMMSKTEHSVMCHGNTEEIKRYFSAEMVKFQDMLDLKIENAILKAMRKINGGQKKDESD